MSSFEKIEKEFKEVLKEGKALFNFLKERKQCTEFGYNYQSWLVKAERIIEFVFKEKKQEFLEYYHDDSKKIYYSIKTYIQGGNTPSLGLMQRAESEEDRRSLNRTKQNLENQLQIFSSLEALLESSYHNLELSLFSDIESAELFVAKQLTKVNIRAAGALAGVVLESHLKHVAKKHKLDIDTNNSTISPINDKLRKESVYGIDIWRKIQYLNDIRTICSHEKEEKPTQEKVKGLIDGTDSIVRQIF